MNRELVAMMRSSINVQDLTVAALMTERRDHLYHVAMMDPHTAAELDLDQVHDLIDAPIAASIAARVAGPPERVRA